MKLAARRRGHELVGSVPGEGVRTEQCSRTLRRGLDSRWDDPTVSHARATKSQLLFERFCHDHGLNCRPIPVGPSRTADYRIEVAGHEVVAEVKQLDPNRRDRAAALAIEAGGVGEFGGEAGSRIRHVIDKGKQQISALARGRHPGILVVYNNVLVCPTYTDPMFVMIAMYGHLTVDLELPVAGGGPPKVRQVRHGAKSKVSATSNTSLSALCVMTADEAARVFLAFYHNKFAALRFAADWLRAPEVKHYGLPNDAGRSVRAWAEI